MAAQPTPPVKKASFPLTDTTTSSSDDQAPPLEPLPEDNVAPREVSWRFPPPTSTRSVPDVLIAQLTDVRSRRAGLVAVLRHATACTALASGNDHRALVDALREGPLDAAASRLPRHMPDAVSMLVDVFPEAFGTTTVYSCRCPPRITPLPGLRDVQGLCPCCSASVRAPQLPRIVVVPCPDSSYPLHLPSGGAIGHRLVGVLNRVGAHLRDAATGMWLQVGLGAPTLLTGRTPVAPAGYCIYAAVPQDAAVPSSDVIANAPVAHTRAQLDELQQQQQHQQPDRAMTWQADTMLRANDDDTAETTEPSTTPTTMAIQLAPAADHGLAPSAMFVNTPSDDDTDDDGNDDATASSDVPSDASYSDDNDDDDAPPAAMRIAAIAPPRTAAAVPSPPAFGGPPPGLGAAAHHGLQFTAFVDFMATPAYATLRSSSLHETASAAHALQHLQVMYGLAMVTPADVVGVLPNGAVAIRVPRRLLHQLALLQTRGELGDLELE